MKKLFFVAIFLPLYAFAQSAPSMDEIDRALSIERMAGNNALAIKDHRIADLQRQLQAMSQKAASCEKPPAP